MQALINNLVLLLVGIGCGLLLGGRLNPPHALNSQHVAPTIEQVQALASLVTTRVDVSDIQETEIQGHAGGIRAALLVKGDFLLGVDLSKAKFDSIDVQTHQAVLVLPQPRVSSPRLDHTRTRLFAVCESGLWQIVPGDRADTAVVNAAYRDAQQLVTQVSTHADLLDRSRRQAEQVLRCFFEALGWTVTVRWPT